MRRFRSRFAAALLLAPCVVPPAAAQQGVTVTLVANEGVMIAGGGRKVLIDALFERYGPEYPVPHDSTCAALARAARPFDRVDLVLATHWHGDHFHPAPVAAHLRANPRARFVAPRRVVDSLQRHPPARAIPAARLVAGDVADGTRHRESINGMTIEWLGIPHARGNPLRRRVPHTGWLVELGGRRVVHLGDAELTPETLAPLRLDTMQVDVALVPFWVLLTEEGRRAIARHVRARQVVAIHLPAQDLDRALGDLRRVAPDAVPLVRSLDARRW